jgi:hypothetical protein
LYQEFTTSMDRTNSSTDFVTIEELVVLSGQSRRTIERKMDRLKKVDSKSFNELIAHEVSSGGRPRSLYHRDGVLTFLSGKIPKPKPATAKSISSTRLQFVREEKKRPEPKQDVVSDFDTMDESQKFAVVVAVCDLFEKGNLQLPVACESMGLTHTQFFRLVTSSPMLFEKWERSRRNWLNTHGSMLEFQLYTVLLDKLTKKKTTKKVTFYESREVFEGGQLVTKEIPKGSREISEDYNPDTAVFMMGKKLLDEIMLLNASNVDPVPEMEGKSWEELDQLERELTEKAKLIGLNP